MINLSPAENRDFSISAAMKFNIGYMECNMEA